MSLRPAKGTQWSLVSEQSKANIDLNQRWCGVALQLTLMQLEETNTQKTSNLTAMIPVVAVTA